MAGVSNPKIQWIIPMLVAVPAILCTAALGKTIYVGDVGQADFDTIQAGIDAALDGDTVLVAPGEYVITEPITFRGKAITVKSETGSDETTIRMGTPVDPERASVVVFENNETAASVLEGFTITGGTGFRLWVPGESEFAWCGGGILFHASSGTVRNCAIVQNRAKHAGGVMTCSEAFVILIDCIVAGNTAEGGACGGVMCWDSSSVIMTECIIRGNSTMSAGGGVCCGSHDSSTPSSVTMTNCEIMSNTAARFGGGIYARNASATLTNCVIARNTGGWGGGGVGTSGGSYYGPSSIQITNCTITGNSGAVDAGGGGVVSYGRGSIGAGSITITNSIICGNTSAKGPEISLMGGEKIRVAYSNVTGGQTKANVEGGSTLDWSGGNIDADPYFADPNNEDYHLKSQAGRWDPNSQTWVQDDVTSPCIDAGDPNSDWSAELWPHGERINMGAYGGTREASMSTHPEVMSLPRVAFIYSSDSEAAESFRSLLVGYGCSTTLIALDDVPATPLDSYDLVIVGDDTEDAAAWNDPQVVPAIEGSGRSIIGMGEGGYDFFGMLELPIGRPNGMHGDGSSIYTVDPNSSLFSTPYSIDIPEDEIIQLYTEFGLVLLYLWPVPETVTVLGGAVNQPGYYPLAREHDRYLFWGFTESPLKMTEDGKRLFINTVIRTANKAWES